MKEKERSAKSERILFKLTGQVSQTQYFQGAGGIGVVIPVYGESEQILSVLRNFPTGFVDTICLVVDVPHKGNMDRVRAVARECGTTVHIIKNREKKGVGYGLRQGLLYLAETSHSIVVIMAGNGKDDP